MATSTVKLENCEVCGANKAKYTCPKCEVRTCCLGCVNIHKKELECDGIRDKTKYVPLKSFTDLDVLSDYRLLEDVGRTVEKLKKDPLKKCSRQFNLPVHLHKLKAAAFSRKVNLQFMPQHFSRHKNNTTFLNWKSNKLYWRIEWIFPQAESTMCITEKALETTRLSQLVEDILDPVKSLEKKDDIEEINLRMRLNDRLQFYQSAGLSGIKVLLKAEKIVNSNFKFFELDATLSLKENLENKTIIEYPIVYIILKDHAYMYEIVESDDEAVNNLNHSPYNNNSTSKRRRRVFNDSNRKKEKNSTANYFFNSGSSESEEESQNDASRNKNANDLHVPDYNELVKMEH